MALSIILSFLAAFAVTFLSGKFLVPWLKKHGFIQPLKEEVVQKIYRGKYNDHTTGKPKDPD